MSTPAPEGPVAALMRAASLCELRRFPEAENVIRRLIATDPQDARAWCLLAQAQVGQKKAREALDSARKATAIAPEEEWPHRLVSVALSLLHDHRGAAQAAEKAVTLGPHEWRTHTRLAQALAHVPTRLDEAGQAAHRAIELAPGEADAHIALGAVEAAAGRPDPAAQSFKRALAIDPQNAVAHHELARMKLVNRRYTTASAGRLADAARGYATAIRADPRSEVSRRNLDAVLQLFLRWLSYFLFIDAYLASWLTHRGRAVPLIALAIPAAFALRFIARLPGELRPYLRRVALSEGYVIATVLDAAAIGCLIAAVAGARSSRTGFVVGAAVCAAVARMVLWAMRQNAR